MRFTTFLTVVILTLPVAVGVIGCDMNNEANGRTEPNLLYSKSVAKMNAVEFMIHRELDNEWRGVNTFGRMRFSGDPMYYVRSAVSSRSKAPSVDKIPFCDVAEVILKVNADIIPAMNRAGINRYEKPTTKYTLRPIIGANDPEWLSDLQRVCIDEAKVARERKVLSIKLEEAKRVDPPSPSSNQVVIKEQEALPLSEIKDLQEEIMGCRLAGDLVMNKLNTNGFLTVSDRNEVMTAATRCLTIQMQYELNKSN